MDAEMGQSMHPPNESPAPEPPAAESEGGDVICVRRLPDGRYSVYRESDGQEEAGETGEMPGAGSGEGAGEDGEPLENLEQALKMVVKLDRERPVGENPAKGFASGYQEMAQ